MRGPRRGDATANGRIVNIKSASTLEVASWGETEKKRLPARRNRHEGVAGSHRDVDQSQSTEGR
jgi:regulator of RNase E activity RraA